MDEEDMVLSQIKWRLASLVPNPWSVPGSSP